jgi:competence protein ComEC
MDFREVIRQYSLLRLLLPLVTGIFLASYFALSLKALTLAITLATTFVLLILLVPALLNSLKLQYLYGICVFFLFLYIGSYRYVEVKENNKISNPDSAQAYILKINELPIAKMNSYSCRVKVLHSFQDSVWKYEKANAIVYFQKDSLVLDLKIGNHVLVNQPLKSVVNAGNPYEFDYSGYLKNQHILYTAYVPANSWESISINDRIRIKELGIKWREKLLQIYREAGIKNDAYDILAALTLGYKTNIDPDLRQAWADAGTVHVLAVSGLHVGIVYLIMGFLLSFLNKKQWGQIIKSTLLLISLWFYALLTGLSPSVIRAACMFSFFIFGEMFGRRGNAYNTLAISAFFMLLYDPFLLFNLGFQFSYLAVLGIVFFQPKLDKLIFVPNKLLNKFWQLTTVSIAAQLVTFPMAIFYFNQFPTYFLLSGYVVISLAGILIYLSVLLLIVHPFEWIAQWIARLLQQMVDFMNWTIIWIKDLPGAVIENLVLNSYQLVLIYLILFSMIFMLVLKKKRAVFVLIILLVLWHMPSLMDINKKPESEITVFNAGRNTILAFSFNHKAQILVDKNISVGKMKRIVNPYLLNKGVESFEVDTLKDIDIRAWEGLNILSVSEYHKNIKQIIDSLSVDLIHIRKGGESNFYRDSTIILPKCIIDASVYGIRKKKMHLISNGQQVHDIKESGAFQYLLSTQN